MEPKEILIPVKLTPKVLEGLEDDKDYFVIEKGQLYKAIGFGIKGDFLKDFTHIYLPLTVTNEMVEKEAEEQYPYIQIEEVRENENKWNRIQSKRRNFVRGVNWLLSLNKE